LKSKCLTEYMKPNYAREHLLSDQILSDNHSSERSLVERVLAEDNEACKEFIVRYKRLIGHIIYRMVDNPADREDLCQEIWIKAFKHLKHFQFRSLLSTWLGRITYNTVINHLRKSGIPLYNDISVDFEDSETELHYKNTAVTSEQIVERRELSAEIDTAIRKLPEQYRLIITLFHLDGMNYHQIGDITGLPEGTVKSHLFRARKALKKILTASLKGEDIYQ